MKHLSKKIVVMLTATCIIAGVFTGCNNKKTTADADKTQKPAATTSGQLNEPLTLPIVEKPLTLTYWCNLDPKMGATLKSYGELLTYQEMEKKTGIKVEFKHPPANQANEQFNLMVASGDLPDMIEWNWSTLPGGPAKAIQDGVAIELNDLINKYSPNLKAIFDKNPEAKRQALTDNGQVYLYPYTKLDDSIKRMRGFQIRKDWLDKLGLAMPTNMDEWYKVLTAFKTKDPNGNGKNDEIPYVALKLGGVTKFMSGWGMTYDFYQDNGKMKYGPVEPEFKDFLTTMNKWYKEGLIDQDFAAVDSKMFDAKITGDQGGSWNAGVMSEMGRYIQLMKGPVKLSAVTAPKSIKEGKAYDFDNTPAIVDGWGTAITAKNKHTKETAKWLDYPYSEEGHMLFSFGVEGKTYKMVNGYPQFTDEVLKNPAGWAIDQGIGHFTRGAIGSNNVPDSRVYEQRKPFQEQKDVAKIWGQASMERRLPVLSPSKEDSQRLASIMSQVNTYVDEMTVKFIMGQEPIEKFDAYMAAIKKMNIEEAIKIRQSALDRFNSRK